MIVIIIWLINHDVSYRSHGIMMIDTIKKSLLAIGRETFLRI